MRMDASEWLKVVSAVLVGNLLTVWWCYSMWRITGNEKKGIDPSRGPFIYLIGVIVPPLVGALGAYFVKASG